MIEGPDADALVEALAVALEQMVDASCVTMAPLWLESTRRARAEHGLAAPAAPSFEVDPSYLRMRAPSRTRYRQLAAWRHAVVWRRVRERLDCDPDFVRAVDAVYFTPCANEPPYAWTQSASSMPSIASFPSATTAKEWAKEGAWACARALYVERRGVERAGWGGLAVFDLLGPATRPSLTDVLKLEEMEDWSKG